MKKDTSLLIIILVIITINTLYSLNNIIAPKKVLVFGASGGVGQQICHTLIESNMFSVTAISRDITKLKEYNLLSKCDMMYADARVKNTITSLLLECNQDNNDDNIEAIVISVGTTAFPTKKWKDGNNPKAACYDTVNNILISIEEMKYKPKKIVLLSSIGVERKDLFPFKILNLYGVLEEKKKSEELLIKKCINMGITSIICRPGRLVGAPFTNFDLAKLLNKDQGENKGVILDTRDVLAGDVERKDVAESVKRFLLANDLQSKQILYSIINKAGNQPNDYEWGKLLSLFTVSPDDLLNTRYSS